MLKPATSTELLSAITVVCGSHFTTQVVSLHGSTCQFELQAAHVVSNGKLQPVTFTDIRLSPNPDIEHPV